MQPPTPRYSPTYSPTYDFFLTDDKEESPLEEGEIELSDIEKVKKVLSAEPGEISAFLQQDDFPLSHGEMIYQFLKAKDTSAFILAEYISDTSLRMGLDLFIENQTDWPAHLKELMTEAVKGPVIIQINRVINSITEEEWDKVVKTYVYNTPIRHAKLLSALEKPLFTQALINHYYSQADEPKFIVHWLTLASRVTADIPFRQLIDLFPENKRLELANHAKKNLEEFCPFLVRSQKTYDPSFIHKFFTPLFQFYTRKELLDLIHYCFENHPELFYTLLYTLDLALLSEIAKSSLYLQPVHKVSPLEFRVFYLSLDQARINFFLSLNFGTFGFREPPTLVEVINYLHNNYSLTQFIGEDEEKVLHSIPPILCPMLLFEDFYPKLTPFLNRLNHAQIQSLGVILSTANSLGFLTSLREHFSLDNFAELIKSMPTEALTPFLEEEAKKRNTSLETLLSVKNPTLAEIATIEQLIVNITKNHVEKIITLKLEELSGKEAARIFNQKLDRLNKKCEAYKQTHRIEKKRAFEKSSLIEEKDEKIGILHDGDLTHIFKEAVDPKQQEFLLNLYRSQPDLPDLWKKFRKHHISSLHELIEMEIPMTEVFNLHLVADKLN